MRLVSFDPYRSLGLPGVQYIKPELWLRHRELVRSADWVLFPQYWQINALIYGLKRRIFPSANSYHLGHDKIEMTRALTSVCPAHVPITEILPATDSAIDKVLEQFEFPFVVKQVRSSMGQGVHLMENRRQFLAYAQHAPLLYVQEYLPITRDLRVVVIGDRVVCAYWREGGDGFHFNVAQGGRIEYSGVPAQAVHLVMEAAQTLGIDHAGFDVAEVDGHYYILEFNILFGTSGLKAQGIASGNIIMDYLCRRTPVFDGPQCQPPRAA